MNIDLILVKDKNEFIYVIIFNQGELTKPILIMTKFEFEMLIKLYHTKINEESKNE